MGNRTLGFVIAVFVCAFGNSVFAVSTNTALRFDGSNDFVSVLDSDLLSPHIFTGQMTLSLWVNIDPGTNGAVIAKGASFQGWEYGVFAGTGAGLQLWTSGGGNYEAVGAPDSLTAGEWHNITTTYYKGQFLKVYMDGVLAGESTASANPNISQGNGRLCFGKEDHSNHPYNFSGALDEVQLWNYAKTDDEVALSFDQSLIGNEDGLVAYWNFNEGSGQALTDLTGHGLNGTLGTSANIDIADPIWVTSTAPEPATMALLGLGAIMLRRRK